MQVKKDSPIVKRNALFSSEITFIMLHITPYLEGCIALPIPSSEQEKNENYPGGWRGVVELVIADMKDEPGVTCENAMDMITSCAFKVHLQNKETAMQAKKRVKKAFMKSWNKFVSNVRPGAKL